MSFDSRALLFLFVLKPSVAPAHEGHHHGSHTQASKTSQARDETKLAYIDIQKMYLAEVSPIFEMKCAACHSETSPSPWYAKVPGLHQLIEKDRFEAKEHKWARASEARLLSIDHQETHQWH